jgi:hypothetical protein
MDNMADKVSKGRQSHLCGETHPLSKLTEQDVVAIRQASGKLLDIAKDYSVSKSLVFMVKHRQAWAHI